MKQPELLNQENHSKHSQYLSNCQMALFCPTLKYGEAPNTMDTKPEPLTMAHKACKDT